MKFMVQFFELFGKGDIEMDRTLQDIRNEIDQIDFSILDLLRTRQDLVISAARFKVRREGDNGVIAPERIRDMMADRRKEAERLGLDVTFVDEVCRVVIDHMIGLEMVEWRKDV